MKLYSLPLSPFAARVRCSIYAKDLPVEILTPASDWRTSGEVKQFNPMNRVPVLVLDDGMALPESQVILDYLDHAFSPPLLPADPIAAAKVRLVGRVADGYIATATGPIFQALNPKTGFDAEQNAPLLDALYTALGHLEATLGDGPYARGETLTQADCVMGPQRFILEVLKGLTGQPELLAATPRIEAYSQTVEADPVLSRVRGEMTRAAEIFMASWRKSGDPTEASKAAST